ncbi:hypothetical protein ABH908_000342 [Pseudomonas frederiksbergensis]|uniref:hypothetical protein n=1 Tax=Pseudomonas TaxID=286 RepID=UPI003D1CDD35
MTGIEKTPSASVAFEEWRYRVEGGSRLPRGRFFAGKGPSLKAYQVGDCDIVAAFSASGAIDVLCEQTDYPRSDYTLADVTRVGRKTLDSLEVFNQDEGKVETLETSLRQDIAILAEPTYMHGWE